MIEQGTLTCPCGSRVPFSEGDDRVYCECGANYIVTVTRITAPVTE